MSSGSSKFLFKSREFSLNIALNENSISFFEKNCTILLKLFFEKTPNKISLKKICINNFSECKVKIFTKSLM